MGEVVTRCTADTMDIRNDNLCIALLSKHLLRHLWSGRRVYRVSPETGKIHILIDRDDRRGSHYEYYPRYVGGSKFRLAEDLSARSAAFVNVARRGTRTIYPSDPI